MKKIQEWLNLPKKSKEECQKFQPLRMTVLGQAGTGKSRLINTLVSVIRKMFQSNNSVHVAAPTGVAAHAVGGQTIHRIFSVNTGPQTELGATAKENLGKLLETTIALFFDERSMISQNVLGAAEMNISSTAHNFGHDSEDWGGIPVVVIFGDDYQLPSIEPGAFDCFNCSNNESIGKKTNGRRHFIILGKTVMELQQVMRQQEKETLFMRILNNIRLGKATNEDIAILMSLHLNDHRFTEEDRKKIRENAMYIYANKAPMQEHNRQKLKEQNSEDNPVARIHTTTTTKSKKYRGVTKHFRQQQNQTAIPSVVNICRGAKVQLTGKNFEPDWGLYNGSIGIVKEIVFKENENPLEGFQPDYVIVDFPQYCGPQWMAVEKTWVPIPVVEMNCDKHCCQLQYIPLTLAYAKTCHTFQGQTVGKNNPISCIIVQPGTRDFEGKCPGLFYVFLSRATDIGSPEDRTTSAIFFEGQDMNSDRIKDLTHSLTTGKEYAKVTKRNLWVKYLQNHLIKPEISKQQKSSLIRWCQETVVTKKEVKRVLQDPRWRKSHILNY
jgi:ATP-dependent exoDNAse (exonuclease V) alpha subunit